MVFSSAFRASVVLSALFALPVANAVHIIMGGMSPIVTERVDPIVSPGTIGGHVHQVFGASNFGETYDYATSTQAKCTSAPIPQDKSNYWVPKFYLHNTNNGSFTPMNDYINVYYLVRNGPGEQVVPPPNGLRMVAGDTTRRTFNASSLEDQAVSFVCLDYSGSHNNDPAWAQRNNFFAHNCPNGMRNQVFFPSCWDGKNLDSPDHKSHMSYPVSQFDNGPCPASHPVHIISIFYEYVASTGDYPYGNGYEWVLANGDNTGYGMHGDFTMGWTDPDLINQLINNCPNAAGNIADCPALNAVLDTQAASACRFEGSIVDENIGLNGPINALPGCNPVWDGTGTKPACGATPTPGLESTQQTLLAGWSQIGCIAEGTNGRALTGATYTDTVNMTLNSCASYCGGKGFKYAGVEWSQECYCGSSLLNGASTNTVSADQCSNACTGDSFMNCGGPQRLTLLQATPGGAAPVVSSSAAPSAVSVSAVVSASSVVSSAVSASSVVSSKVASSVVSSVVSSTLKSAPTVPALPLNATTSNILVPTSIASTSSPTASPVAGIPAGWSGTGCFSDNAQRALSSLSFDSDFMTVDWCVQTCNDRGFSMAGVENGRECYCGNSFMNGAGSPLAASHCTMTCPTDKQLCGGGWAMNVYTKGSSSKRSVKARHFGRHAFAHANSF